ncbi:MAG: ATP-binding protein [Desulfovibrio sp.]|jgi:hypothetical protein|nr:ATP-binding protein [Desulfovibrio sp.]
MSLLAPPHPLPPIEDPLFDAIREANEVYVDKTGFIQRMVSGRKRKFFCARPRRFGKSLMVTTLESFFRGEKELFQGLAIEEYMESDAYSEHPVISLDMSAPRTRMGIGVLQEGLMAQLGLNASANGVSLRGTDPTVAFGNLMEDIHKKSGRLVILIDEYDAPLLRAFNKAEIYEDVREELRDFYTMIKPYDKQRFLRLVFITGISKFAKLGIFSGLNNVTDISFEDEYATMFGYTEKEILDNFSAYIEIVAEKLSLTPKTLMGRLRDYYDGYFFGGTENVYNPVSIVSFFEKNKFAPYWIRTGSQEFITKYISERKVTLSQFENITISPEEITEPGEITRNLSPEYFLYQAGYLTVRVTEENGKPAYYLTYPNYEVRAAMLSLITNNFFKVRNAVTELQRKFANLLYKSAYAEAFLEFNEVLERIPYDDAVDSEAVGKVDSKSDGKVDGKTCGKADGKVVKLGQAHYREPILGFLYGSELFFIAEIHSNKGRPDIVFDYGEKTFVIELKTAIGEKKSLNELLFAMKQMDEGNYTGRFPNPVAVGLVVDEKDRLITHICIETDVYHVQKRKLTHLGKLNELAAAADGEGK